MERKCPHAKNGRHIPHRRLAVYRGNHAEITTCSKCGEILEITDGRRYSNEMFWE